MYKKDQLNELVSNHQPQVVGNIFCGTNSYDTSSGVIKLPTQKISLLKENPSKFKISQICINFDLLNNICINSNMCIYRWHLPFFNTPQATSPHHAELHNLHDLSHPTCNTWSMGVPTNSMPGTQSMRVEAKTLGITSGLHPPPPTTPVSIEGLGWDIPTKNGISPKRWLESWAGGLVPRNTCKTWEFFCKKTPFFHRIYHLQVGVPNLWFRLTGVNSPIGKGFHWHPDLKVHPGICLIIFYEKLMGSNIGFGFEVLI